MWSLRIAKGHLRGANSMRKPMPAHDDLPEQTRATTLSSVRAFMASAALAVAGLAHSASSLPAVCTPQATPESSSRGFVEATLRNAPSVVSVVVVRARRDPLED